MNTTTTTFSLEDFNIAGLAYGVKFEELEDATKYIDDMGRAASEIHDPIKFAVIAEFIKTNSTYAVRADDCRAVAFVVDKAVFAGKALIVEDLRDVLEAELKAVIDGFKDSDKAKWEYRMALDSFALLEAHGKKEDLQVAEVNFERRVRAVLSKHHMRFIKEAMSIHIPADRHNYADVVEQLAELMFDGFAEEAMMSDKSRRAFLEARSVLFKDPMAFAAVSMASGMLVLIPITQLQIAMQRVAAPKADWFDVLLQSLQCSIDHCTETTQSFYDQNQMCDDLLGVGEGLEMWSTQTQEFKDTAVWWQKQHQATVQKLLTNLINDLKALKA
jgi:hypothetical protein